MMKILMTDCSFRSLPLLRASRCLRRLYKFVRLPFALLSAVLPPAGQPLPAAVVGSFQPLEFFVTSRVFRGHNWRVQ